MASAENFQDTPLFLPVVDDESCLNMWRAYAQRVEPVVATNEQRLQRRNPELWQMLHKFTSDQDEPWWALASIGQATAVYGILHNQVEANKVLGKFNASLTNANDDTPYINVSLPESFLQMRRSPPTWVRQKVTGLTHRRSPHLLPWITFNEAHRASEANAFRARSLLREHNFSLLHAITEGWFAECFMKDGGASLNAFQRARMAIATLAMYDVLNQAIETRRSS
ncbi:MAG TPA: hypothetical protein VLG16_01970 [Candidatus Saccharimonadales bacterium]|nr:hypothetical protein [Candidatus Saccharimonadales bacterium]